MEQNSNEHSDKLVLNITNNDLEIDLTEVAIDFKHRFGYPKKKKKKFGSIIIKFVKYYDRKDVFLRRKILMKKVFQS